MRRTRSLTPWSDVPHHAYKNDQDFLHRRIEAGIHSVPMGGQFVDLLIEDRGAEVTLIAFHSALGRKVETTPVFQRLGLAKSQGMNLISVADPSVAIEGLSLGWHIGNRECGPLKPVLLPVLRHTLESLRTERAVLFGSSGGGYAAIHYGDVWPDAAVLVMNPRLDLGATPKDAFARFAKHCYPGEVPEEVLHELEQHSPSRSYEDGLPFDLCIFQNSGDQLYLENQFGPFVELMRDDPRLFVRVEYTAEGHAVVPGSLLRAMLTPFKTMEPGVNPISEAGFIRAAQYALVCLPIPVTPLCRCPRN